MKSLLFAATSVALLSPVVAQAQEVELSYGVAANATATGGNVQFTVEGYVGAAINGAFVNLWAATLDDGSVEDAEIELSLGYGFTLGTVDTTLTYTRYYLDDAYQTQDIALDFGVPVNDKVTALAAVAYDLDSKVWDLSAGAEFAITDSLALAMTFGDDGTGKYTEIGLTKTFDKGVFVGLTYEDSDYGDSALTLSAGIDF